MPRSQKVTLGLVQMRCAAEPEENLGARPSRRSARRRRAGAQIICLPELFRSQYFCQIEDHEYFELAEEIPGPRTRRLRQWRARRASVIIASLFEKRGAGLYHNTAAIIDADGELPREVSQDAHPGRPALLREVLFHAGRSRLSAVADALCARSASAFAGTNGIPRRRGSRRCTARRFFFTRPPSAGIPARRSEYGARQHDAWETIQRSHAIANGCYVAVPNRVGHEAPDGGAGHRVLGPEFHRRSRGQDRGQGLGATEEEMLVVEVGSRGARRASARTGRFSATAASTPTADIEKRFID